MSQSLLAFKRSSCHENGHDDGDHSSPMHQSALLVASDAVGCAAPENTAAQKGAAPTKDLLEDVSWCRLLTPSARSSHPRGLRGLNNMGHTCFMNAILQALLHTPLLPEHHLSHGHARQGCPVTRDGGFCVACELDGVFSAAYSGSRSPFSPSAFLYSWWRLAGEGLSGYKQQDAHEFLLFILEMVSSSAGADSVVPRLFDGVMRSDMVCCACGATSTTEDAFTNISLDVPPPTRLVPKPIMPRPNMNSINGKVGATAARASRHLVGAAKKAHLARLSRQTAAPAPAQTNAENHPGRTEQTPEHESELSKSGPPPLPPPPIGEESVSCDDIDGRPRGGRPSPPIWGPNDHTAGGSNNLLSSVREQGSGADADAGGTATTAPPFTDDASRDTLSSPPRRSRGGATAKRGQAPPSPHDNNGNNKSSLPSTEKLDHPSPGASQRGPVLEACALHPHPALAGFLRWPGASLIGCLKHFVWPEELESSFRERWCCPCCGRQEGAVKQLSISRLPPILVLHAKRFEYSGGLRATAKKLDTYLSFPLKNLDMGPYLASNALRTRNSLRRCHNLPGEGHQSQDLERTIASKRQRNKDASPHSPVSVPRITRSAADIIEARGGEGVLDSVARRTRSSSGTLGAQPLAGVDALWCATTSATRGSALPAATATGLEEAALNDQSTPAPVKTAAPLLSLNRRTTLYDVFAVVCHRGTFQGGHYVAYVRCENDQWYLCDDAYVAPVSEEVVKNCQAYMLFYGQQRLFVPRHECRH